MIDNRPLSPHLSIHKKVLTSVFSIFHRITGIGLSIGSILIALWISLISFGPKYFFIFELISNTLRYLLTDLELKKYSSELSIESIKSINQMLVW